MPAGATWGSQFGVARPGVERTRPRYSVEDLTTLVWRQGPLMLATFLVIAAAGVIVALSLKSTYVANSSLLVRLGQEYVYDPRIGDAGRGAAPANDAIMQSEVEILNSAALKERVIHDIGFDRLAPQASRPGDGASGRSQSTLINAMEQQLKVATAPNAAVVHLSYSDRDARRAALVLNTLVDEYLVYRRQVLVAHDTGPLEGQRRLAERQLAAVDRRYTKFLADNGIGDFDAEKASLAALYGQLLTDSYSAGAQLSETQGRLSVIARQAAATPREIGLYHDLDHSASDRLAALKVELQDLLGRYQLDSPPVRDKEAQVAAMEQLAGRTRGQTADARVGLNPLYQTAQTERNTLEAQLASLRSRKATDESEIARVLTRRQRLAAIDPDYLELSRQRDLLSGAVRNFATREQESQAASALSAGGDDSVRVIQRAYVPMRGASLKSPVLGAGLVFAAFTAACVGVLAALLSRSFPSEQAVERTLDLPVLATARSKT